MDDTGKFLYKPHGMYPASLTNPKTGKVIDKPLELSGRQGPSLDYLDVTLSLTDNGFIEWKLFAKRVNMLDNGKSLS